MRKSRPTKRKKLPRRSRSRRRVISTEYTLSSEPSGKHGIQYIHITGQFGVWVRAPKGKQYKALELEP